VPETAAPAPNVVKGGGVVTAHWVIRRPPDAASGISLAHRVVSRSGHISAIPMMPRTSMMTPQIIKPVLKPASGVAAVSTMVPMK
jgi:hypothetical protein